MRKLILGAMALALISFTSCNDEDDIIVPQGGTLSGGPFTFIVGDGIADNVSGISLTGNVGTNSTYVITDADANILGLPGDLTALEAEDFDGAPAGICLIWHLSYEDGLQGAAVGENANNLSGSFALSNAITINRDGAVIGGTLTGGPFSFIVGDGVADNVSGIALTGNAGTNSTYVITDADANILGLPGDLTALEAEDFDGAPAGVCLIWHLSYEDGLQGAEVGESANDLSGDFSLSNSITINRTAAPMGGTLSGGPFTFWVGDGIADNVSGISLTGNVGTNSTYVITDADANILGLPGDLAALEAEDFDGAPAGVCLIWHLSYEDGLEGAVMGESANDLSGTFSLSNSITINRNAAPMGGTLSGGPFTFIVGDGVADNVSGISLADNVGTNSTYVITDADANILGLPGDLMALEAEDFDGAPAGVCLIWHLSYEDGLQGAMVGESANNLSGTFSLSNSITINRNPLPMGGTLSGGPFTFTVGDGIADNVSGITLTGAVGTNSTYVITDADANILGLPGDLAALEAEDFDGAPAGVCLIWHLSYEDGLQGAMVGENANDLSGTFSLSNSITINRN